MKTEYTQRLPHIQPIGAVFFVTFSLFGSVPRRKLQELKEQYIIDITKANKIPDLHQRNLEVFYIRKKYLLDYDLMLHAIVNGPFYLKNDQLKNLIKDEIFRYDGHLYHVLCFCIMSNHVHILIDTSIQLSGITDQEELDKKYVLLDQIMKKIKGPTAMYCNKALNRTGQFWERESFDMYIRNNTMLNNVISYILQNPVKAGMVKEWNEYPYNYVRS
ncbi:MAG: hypothetical protein RIR48_2156 [Bacteroidota bacterium]